MEIEVVAAGPTPAGRSFEVYKTPDGGYCFCAEVKTVYDRRLAWLELAAGANFGVVYNNAWNKLLNPIKAIFIEPGIGMIEEVELEIPTPQAVFDGFLLPVQLPNGDTLYTDVASSHKRGGNAVWYYDHPEFPNGMKGFVGPGVILRRESSGIVSPKTSLGEALLSITWEDELVM